MPRIDPLPPPSATPTPTPGHTPVRTELPARPRWAQRLDRAVLRLARAARLLLPRPDDAQLDRLARKDRGPRPQRAALPAGSLDAARAALAQQRLGEALHLFGQLTAADPSLAWAWHGRGDALHLLGQHADALDAYSKAAALAPRQGLHQGGRANALRALDQLRDADQAWQEALRLDPSLTWMRDGQSPPG